jgi:thiol-disulfide isomerase/thioredoxin
MDRLPALIVVALAAAAAGCESSSNQPAGEPAGRVNASKGKTKNVSTEAFCDVHFAKDKAPSFAAPTLATGTMPPAAPGRWRWVNVWATWCKPCLEEMPRLQKWRDRLTAGGRPVDLVFVSIDKDDPTIASFRTTHPEIPEGGRADPAAWPTWLKTIGLDAEAPIPIHVWVDPDGKMRCVRAGGVREQDQDAVDLLFSQG